MDKVTQQSQQPASRPAMDRITRFAALALIAGFLSACSTASYPSLARREAETLRAPATAPQPIAPAPLSAAVVNSLAALLADARAADVRFAAAQPLAQTALAAASGQKAGDRGWSTANMALSELERARGDMGVALAGISTLYAQDRLAHPQADPAPQLTEAQAALLAKTKEQDKLLTSLRAKLR